MCLVRVRVRVGDPVVGQLTVRLGICARVCVHLRFLCACLWVYVFLVCVVFCVCGILCMCMCVVNMLAIERREVVCIFVAQSRVERFPRTGLGLSTWVRSFLGTLCVCLASNPNPEPNPNLTQRYLLNLVSAAVTSPPKKSPKPGYGEVGVYGEGGTCGEV